MGGGVSVVGGRAGAILAALVVASTACGGSSGEPGGSGTPTTPTTPSTPTTPTGSTGLKLTPAIAATAPRGGATFTATDALGAAVAVTWRVNNVAGGSAQTGTVSASGVYTAPQTIPAGDSVVVSAVGNADTTMRSAATVFFIPDNTTADYYVPIPRVVDVRNPAPTRFLLVPPAGTAAVTFIPKSGASVALTPAGGNVLTFTFDASAATTGYVAGTLHQFVGRLDYRTANNTQIKLTNLSANVRDAGMPDVAVTPLAADAQRSAYVLNLRVDSATINPSPSIGARALQLLGDRFDFLAVIATVTTNNNRVYLGVRNDVTGIGQTLFNNAAAWGSAGKLRGAIAFPLDNFFDGAEQGFIHEHGHAWINYGTDAQLSPGKPHWPASTMAHGTMGFSIGGTGGAGGNFVYTLTPSATARCA